MMTSNPHLPPLVAEWIAERCVVDGTAARTTTQLYRDFQAWARARQCHSGTVKAFARVLIEKKVARWRDAVGRRGFVGLALRDEPGRAPWTGDDGK
jgi:putative DNA primase/helicase